MFTQPVAIPAASLKYSVIVCYLAGGDEIIAIDQKL